MTAEEFAVRWSQERTYALVLCAARRHLDRGVPHSLLADMAAYRVMVGRMPTEDQVVRRVDLAAAAALEVVSG